MTSVQGSLTVPTDTHRIKVKKIIKMEFDDEELLESEEDDEDEEDPYLTEISEDIPEEIDESLSDDEE